MRHRILKITAYAGYFLVLTGFWGGYLFPSDALIRHAQCFLSQMAPDARLSIDRLGLTLPPGLNAENTEIALRNKSRFQADQIRILPGLVSLFQSRSRHPLSARLMFSEISLELPIPVIDNFQFKEIQAEIGWQGDHLDIVSFAAAGEQMNGSLSGRIQVKTPFENSLLQISGVVHLKTEILARLKTSILSGAVSDLKADGGGISFQIAGTLETPLFSLK